MIQKALGRRVIIFPLEQNQNEFWRRSRGFGPLFEVGGWRRGPAKILKKAIGGKRGRTVWRLTMMTTGGEGGQMGKIKISKNGEAAASRSKKDIGIEGRRERTKF
jgi:hypothetical protein